MAAAVLVFLTAFSLLSPIYVHAHETAAHKITASVTLSIPNSHTVKIGAGNTNSHSDHPDRGKLTSTSVSSRGRTWPTSERRTLSTASEHTHSIRSRAGPKFSRSTSSKSASSSTYTQKPSKSRSTSSSTRGSPDTVKDSHSTRSHHSVSSPASLHALSRGPHESSSVVWHPSKHNVSSTKDRSSGFMTSLTSDARADLHPSKHNVSSTKDPSNTRADLHPNKHNVSSTKDPSDTRAHLPASLTAEPPPLTGKPASSLLAGLATFTRTTTPAVGYISTGVSSDSHSPSGFPIFWAQSHFCSLFCPSDGGCLVCGYHIDIPPGIYPPGSIDFPSDWTEPDITIIIEADGTPVYDEEEETTTTTTSTTTTSTSTRQAHSTTVSHISSRSSFASRTSSATSSVSSSTVSSAGFLCAPTCSACANVAPAPSTDPFKVKRHLQGEVGRKDKRMLDWPDNAPYNGNQNYFIWQQFIDTVRDVVAMSNIPGHASTALYRPLLNQPFGMAVTGLYGCTSLIIISTKGVWMSHFWENPSFIVPFDDPVEQQARFEQQVINILGPGDGNLFPGLTQFINSNGPFSPDSNVQAIIVTPQDRYNPLPGIRMYENMVQQIAGNVTKLFGGNYNQGNHGTLSRPVIFRDYRPDSSPLSQRWSTTGKVLFQYDPVQARCINQFTGQPAQFAQERLWLESITPQVADSYWPAWPFQDVPLPQTKRRSLPSNETEDESDHPELMEKRQEAWTPGVQPSLYPSCFSALANRGTGSAEATATLVGPNGPVNKGGGASGSNPSAIPKTTTGHAPHSAPSVTKTPTASKDSVAPSGNKKPNKDSHPNKPDPTTTSSSSSSTPPPDPSPYPHLPPCLANESFLSHDNCTNHCFEGECQKYNIGAQLRERCFDCIYPPEPTAWMCIDCIL